MKFILTAFLACALASTASAALVIKVDSENKEYYLSGSAIGFPEEGFMFGGGQIAWDNGLALDGGYTDMLSEDAFTVLDNTSSGSFILFLHGNGNVNGAFDFETADLTTLIGNSLVRYDYSWWAGNLQNVLESKAAAGEVVDVVNGASSTYALKFEQAAVPEPTTAALLTLGVLVIAGKRQRTRKSQL